MWLWLETCQYRKGMQYPPSAETSLGTVPTFRVATSIMGTACCLSNGTFVAWAAASTWQSLSTTAWQLQDAGSPSLPFPLVQFSGGRRLFQTCAVQ